MEAIGGRDQTAASKLQQGSVYYLDVTIINNNKAQVGAAVVSGKGQSGYLRFR